MDRKIFCMDLFIYIFSWYLSFCNAYANKKASKCEPKQSFISTWQVLWTKFDGPKLKVRKIEQNGQYIWLIRILCAIVAIVSYPKQNTTKIMKILNPSTIVQRYELCSLFTIYDIIIIIIIIIYLVLCHVMQFLSHCPYSNNIQINHFSNGKSFGCQSI